MAGLFWGAEGYRETRRKTGVVEKIWRWDPRNKEESNEVSEVCDDGSRTQSCQECFYALLRSSDGAVESAVENFGSQLGAEEAPWRESKKAVLLMISLLCCLQDYGSRKRQSFGSQGGGWAGTIQCDASCGVDRVSFLEHWKWFVEQNRWTGPQVTNDWKALDICSDAGVHREIQKCATTFLKVYKQWTRRVPRWCFQRSRGFLISFRKVVSIEALKVVQVQVAFGFPVFVMLVSWFWCRYHSQIVSFCDF